MPSFAPLPQELVDNIIDELGKDYQDPAHKTYPDDRINVTRKGLHACTLVSKNWTGRSRAHLFEKVKVKLDDTSRFLIPPEAIMPYVTKLTMRLRSEEFQFFPSSRLFTLFYAAPIAHLWITNAVLGPGQVYVVEFIAALSATLQTVTFKYCSLPLNMICDIVRAHPELKQLYLHCCEIKDADSDDPTTSQLDTPRSTNLELGIFAPTDPRAPVTRLLTTFAQLPIRFCRLNFDYVVATAHPANTSIEANSGLPSSLTVHIFVRTSKILSQGNIPLTIKLYGSGVSDERAVVHPGRLFQPLRANFGHGGHEFMRCNHHH